MCFYNSNISFYIKKEYNFYVYEYKFLVVIFIFDLFSTKNNANSTWLIDNKLIFGCRKKTKLLFVYL